MANKNPSPKNRFSSENQPEKNGRKPGVKSTSTILKRFLNAEIKETNPVTEELEKMTVQELLILVMIKKALDGDLSSFKEITDRYEGPVTKFIESSATVAVKEFDITKLYDVDLCDPENPEE